MLLLVISNVVVFILEGIILNGLQNSYSHKNFHWLTNYKNENKKKCIYIYSYSINNVYCSSYLLEFVLELNSVSHGLIIVSITWNKI